MAMRLEREDSPKAISTNANSAEGRRSWLTVVMHAGVGKMTQQIYKVAQELSYAYIISTLDKSWRYQLDSICLPTPPCMRSCRPKIDHA